MSKRNTIGIDMGDRNHTYCKLNPKGEVVSKNTVKNTAATLKKCFGKLEPTLFALEAGTHSAWVSHALEEMGHEVLIGNPRKLRAIWDSDEKDDMRDAEMLARIARFDPQLLYPIKHRSRERQLDLIHLKSRALLVKARKMQVSHVRGIVKSMGERVSKCGANYFAGHARRELSSELLEILDPVLGSIEELDKLIADYERKIRELCRDFYPETANLLEIAGVGPLTALSFVLTLEDPKRFRSSRSVGPYVGLVPRRDQSGDTNKQLPITKAGSERLRSLLVGCAQYILGAFGPDCDLRRFGLKLAERGGKNAKKRAVVAVARKLAVKMHRIWADGSKYQPLYRQTIDCAA